MSEDFVNPELARVRLYYSDGSRETVKWPWDKDDLLENAKQVKMAEFFGFGYTSFVYSIAGNAGLLEEYLIVFEKIALTAQSVPVVYAENELQAVELLFQHELYAAVYSVFSLSELSDEEQFEYDNAGWADVLSNMKSNDHFRSYGNGFYGDVGAA
ncbi:hypothetical protein K1728_05440 [Weissella confusa]|uniref:hypothetical protein n=1 Tax=Weissella confusa TaxID=1583 RepID=UPI001C6FB090|nr:hypothetical protein [Weissella confusa]QYU58842.1 hypothetical protein K1728_05440 [Weissella confusa]